MADTVAAHRERLVGAFTLEHLDMVVRWKKAFQCERPG
jgi:hypothetical protein